MSDTTNCRDATDSASGAEDPVPEGSLGRAGSRQARGAPARPAAISLEPARRGSAHHELRRRQHQLEVRPRRSADGGAAARDGGEGQRRRPALDQELGLRDPLSRQARAAHRALSRRRARRRDGRLLPALRVRREPRRRVDRHAAPRLPAVPARRSSAPRLGDRARRERERREEDAGVQRALRAQDHLGPVAASRLRARR